MSHNQIEILTAAHLMGLSQLHQLKLDNNQLEWISGEVFTLLNKLKVLTLHNNKLISLELPAVVNHAADAVVMERDLVMGLDMERDHVIGIKRDHEIVTNDINHVIQDQNALFKHVTLTNNRWRCHEETDCNWITMALDTFNKSSIQDINEV